MTFLTNLDLMMLLCYDDQLIVSHLHDTEREMVDNVIAHPYLETDNGDTIVMSTTIDWTALCEFLYEWHVVDLDTTEFDAYDDVFL